jgi:hypothetical protein
MPTIASTQFEVSQVASAKTALPEVPYKQAVEGLLRPGMPAHARRLLAKWGQTPPDSPAPVPVEACTRYHGRLIADVMFHPLVAAVNIAFNDHRPLCLSPDMIWLLIAQGVANHVNANAETLRSRFVHHQDRLELIVRRDDFVKGSPENPWAEVFATFSEAIRRHIGEATHDLLQPTFSTTGAAEKAATEVVLLDTVQSYFSYVVRSMCGIPSITLEGTAEDWDALGRRVEALAAFDLAWWTVPLRPILGQFAAAARGKADRGFWQSIYKLDGGSGGPYTTGWLTAFFPYLKDRESGLPTHQNRWLAKGGAGLRELLYPSATPDWDRFCHGPTSEQFPAGLARAPFRWEFLHGAYEMEFLGGFVGVRQDAETRCLRPEIGWAVREANK